MMSKFKPFLLGLGIVVGAIALSMGMGALKPETEKEESKKPPLTVRVADAAMKEQVVFATFQGEVRAKTNIELVTQVNGKVTSVSDKFIEGGQFKAGETLIQIDDADYRVALESAKASVASAQVDLEVEQATAATRAKEWSDLQGKPISEANPLVLNKPQIDRAKARLAAAKAELSAAKLNYDRTRISAPFDGRIMSKTAELGQFMPRGSSIGRVFATDSMEVRIPMTDVQISELGLSLGYSSADAAAVIPANVSAAFGDEVKQWKGYVKSVDASVDNQTRLLFATVVVDDPFQAQNGTVVPLVPGLFVDVELASPNKLAGLELPRTALRNGNQVYAFDNEELKLKPVKVIYTSAEKVIVDQEKSAIAMGEKIITSSVPGAYEGMPVKLVADAEQSEAVATDNAVDTEITASTSTEGQAEAGEATAEIDTAEPTDEPENTIESEEQISDGDASGASEDAASVKAVSQS